MVTIGYCFATLLCFWIRDLNFEIIVVDDGSPDGTQEIVKQLQKVYGEHRIVSLRTYLFSSMQLMISHSSSLYLCMFTHAALIMQLLRPRPKKLGLGMYLTSFVLKDDCGNSKGFSFQGRHTYMV